MGNSADEKVLKQEKDGCSDIVKAWPGYAGIGFLVGYITTAIISKEPLWLFYWISVFGSREMVELYVLLLFPILGGIIGGALSMKWWGAVIGGVIAYVDELIILFYFFFD